MIYKIMLIEVGKVLDDRQDDDEVAIAAVIFACLLDYKSNRD